MEYKKFENRVWLSSPTMHGDEQRFVKEAFDSNWVAPLGENVNAFEREMASYVGCSAAAALSSGTAALHLAVKLAGVKQGDVVFCSDLTFSATVNPVSYEDGIQVFIDSEEDTWNMDPKALRLAFYKYDGKVHKDGKLYPKPKAVILVHLYGTPAKVDEIKEICEEYKTVLIEDAAESLGSAYKGKQTGTFGKYSAVSFNGNKIITSSGGGMLLSNDEAAIEKAKYWATQSREPRPYYHHTELGYNYRMSNVVAGIGRGQLLYLDEHKKKKREIYERYKKGFKNLPVKLNPFCKDSEPNFWLSCLLLNEECFATPERIRMELEKYNVESRPIWKPMHMQPVFGECEFISVDNREISREIFEKGLCLPSDIKMTNTEQQIVIDIIKEMII